MRIAKVIAIANQKGGVGKSTTALNLSYALSELGKKVLVVDFDSQSNLTMSMGFDHPDEEIKITTFDLLKAVIEKRELPPKCDYILKVGNVDLIASSMKLGDIEYNAPNIMAKERKLKKILDNLRPDYDFIIIDTMPYLGMMTVNALVACDSVIIPVNTEHLALKGLELSLGTILDVKEDLNNDIKIEGILITMADIRTTRSKEIISVIEKVYGQGVRVFKSIIPFSTKVGEAIYNNKSVIEFQLNNKASIAYKELGKEILK